MHQGTPFITVVILAALSLVAAGCGDATEGQEAFFAILSGSNEVPSNTSGARGGAGIVIAGNRVLYSLDAGAINNVTMAHIHVGAPGANGPVRATLYAGPVRTIDVRTVIAAGTITDADVSGMTLAQLLAEIRSGNAYVNIHTSQLPGGEIRGQLQSGTGN